MCVEDTERVGDVYIHVLINIVFMAVTHTSTCTLHHVLTLSIMMCVFLCSPYLLYDCLLHSMIERTTYDRYVCGRHE